MLDSLTPTGQRYIAQQRGLIHTCAAAWRSDGVHLDAPACGIDGMFVRDGRLWRVAEVKARDLAIADLRSLGSYLVTFDKLVGGRAIGARLGVDFVLIVGLRDALVWWWIADARGEWRAQLSVDRTTTQANCNGGEVERANAYISLRGMYEIEG